MARTATATAGQRLTVSSAIVVAEALTLACWINPVSLSASRVWMSVGNSGNDDDYFALFTDSATVSARKANSGGSGTAAAGNASTGAWQHVAAVFTSANARAAFRDGGNKGTDTTNIAFGGTLNRTGLLHNARASQDQVADGSIAEAAAWSVALTDEEIAMLAKGLSPTKVRPASLLAYWEVVGNDSPEPDHWKGAFPLTIGGSLAKASGPRIYRPGTAR